MFEHEEALAREQLADACKVRIDVVRRIEQRDVEQRTARAKIGERTRHTRADDSIAVLDAAEREVLGDQRLRTAIAFDEDDRRSAAADRFDAERARAGVPIEHPRALDPRRE